MKEDGVGSDCARGFRMAKGLNVTLRTHQQIHSAACSWPRTFCVRVRAEDWFRGGGERDWDVVLIRRSACSTDFLPLVLEICPSTYDGREP